MTSYTIDVFVDHRGIPMFKVFNQVSFKVSFCRSQVIKDSLLLIFIFSFSDGCNLTFLLSVRTQFRRCLSLAVNHLGNWRALRFNFGINKSMAS